MRPVKLVAEGFSVFRERVEIDFAGTDFFVLVGPTGAGKSSVIDAICFALYGSVPRYENENAVAPVITMGVLEARVSLTFEIAGELFIATRVVRRQPKGGATTREARLERVLDAAAGTTESLAGTADELTREVEQRLGLVFKHFTRCVVLPQGEFARFLHDKPAERQQLLVNLLDVEVYDRMGQRARRLSEALKVEAAGRQLRLADLSFATRDAKASAGRRVAALGVLRDQLASATVELDSLAAERDSSEQLAAAAAVNAGHLGEIEMPGQLARAAGELRDLDETVVRAARALTEAGAARKVLETTVGALPELGVLTAAQLALEEAAGLANEIEAAEQALRVADVLAESARLPVETAERAVVSATETLEAVRRQHSAAELATHLRLGADCPVCLQPVAALPSHAKPPGLDHASAAVDRTTREQKVAEKASAAADGAVAAARARVELLAGKQAGVVAKTAAYPDASILADLVAEVRSGTQQLTAARTREQVARDAHAASESSANQVRAALASAWQMFDAQRDPIVALGPPTPARIDLLEDWVALAGWATLEQPRQMAAAAAAEAQAVRLGGEIASKISELAEGCRALGVDIAAADPLAGRGGASVGPRAARGAITEMRERTIAAAKDAEHLLERIADGLAEREKLQADLTSLSERTSVAELLGAHLKATGFQRWLVAEALDLLVEGASDTLRRLSGAQFSLTRDTRNEFVVIDHRNADELRSAKTLSGGETFQASLALALALADQLAGLSRGGAGRLESIFLDEGFGTLDPETLAAVADTIESLGSDERMVGVVTHVRELAERIPVRYEVRKGVRTSTVERLTG